jgi:hypothetical protein
VPQATRSDDHHTYRCYLRGPDGIHGLSPYGPGAPRSYSGASGRSTRNPDLKLVQLAPARPPRVFNMLETRSAPRGIDLDGNDIEPDIHFRQAHAEEKVGSDDLNLTTLALIDRQFGNTECAASSSLDLNKRYKISLPHNEVDFSSSEPDILGKDLPPPTL